MKYLVIDIWSSAELKDEQVKRLQTEQFDKIIFFTQHEWNYLADIEFFNTLLAGIALQSKPLYLVASAIRMNNVSFPNVEIQTWYTFWFLKTYLGLNDFNRKRKQYKIDMDQLTYKKHFVFMNRRAHPWRCEVIDLVAKYDLLKDSSTSWHVDDIDYPFEYFNKQKLLLDTDYSETLEQYELPNEYYETFAQLVSESSNEALLISEKTAMPLLVGKPFLVTTAPGFHKFIKELGFELYDEIFDYSFDTVLDQSTRFEMVVQNFKRLSELPLNELYQLNDKIKDKIIYNQALAETMALDRSYYPPTATEIIEIYENTGTEIERWLVSIAHQLKKIAK